MIMSLSVSIKIIEYVNLAVCLPDTHINRQQRPTEYGSVKYNTQKKGHLPLSGDAPGPNGEQIRKVKL